MNNQFDDYIKIFLEQNSKLNLISKNDEKFLVEKHINDSLSIEKFFSSYKINPVGLTMLDIGTGGGFPAVPVAIYFPELKITALDSIKKKINAVEEIRQKLSLDNLTTLCCRAENFDQKYDIVTARAVSTLKKLLPYALAHLKSDGYFVAYKSIKAQEEIDEASEVLKKFNAKVDKIISYNLNLPENFTRNLIVIRFFKS